jgi:hypothetical protein
MHSTVLALAMLASASAGVASQTGIASAAPARTAATTKAVPQVKDCGFGKNLIKPKSLIVACADAGGRAVSLDWTKWTSTGATATGVYTWNLCVPYCAASNKWGSAKATYALGDAVHARQGWLFEELTIHVTGAAWHSSHRTWTISEKPE